MCGIAGLIHCGQPVDALLAKRMTDLVSYRGPDDQGFACWGQVTNAAMLPSPKTHWPSTSRNDAGGGFLRTGGVVLGHRRLSILDLTDAGHQPMVSGDGRFWIVFNGEIYNYVELQRELAAAGYEFKSSGDTEVILAAYAHWGKDCLHRFNGMWGLVILDTDRNTLFASRDRFGVKPLYWAVDTDRFGFGSEIKQLRAANFGTGRADRFRVAQFLLYQRSNAESETMFEGIRQLLPGEALQWQIDKGTDAIETYRYYKPSYNREMKADGSLDTYREEFKHLLQDAVRLRLRSDVPVGTCLSGGLDSSSIVLTANRILAVNNGHCRQKSFTSCFEDPRFDEWNYAASVVAATGVDSYRVFPNLDQLWEEMDNLTWHQEEPFGSTSAYAQWNVMRLAHENGIKVLLDGQGSDEVMAGYHSYIPVFLMTLAREGSWTEVYRHVRALRQTKVWYAALSAVGGSAAEILAKAARKFLLQGSSSTSQMTGITKQEYMVPETHPIPQGFQDYLYWSIFGGLQPLLRFEDRSSMAFSIEARTPFLDYRLVELFLRMSGTYKLRDGWTKPFLRETLRGVMPEDVRLRADKKGFSTPLTVWTVKHFERIRNMLLSADSPLQLWLDTSKLKKCLNDKSIATDADLALWRMFSVHYWMNKYQLA